MKTTPLNSIEPGFTKKSATKKSAMSSFRLILFLIVSLAATGLCILANELNRKIREQSAEIARLKLENDTLKHSVWYEAQWTMENVD